MSDPTGTPPQIHKRPLDAIAVSPEFFIDLAKEVMGYVSKGDLGEAAAYFGSSEETKRPFGTVYVVPNGKRRVAFPLLWDTEPKKFLYPQLFQALNGPDWPAVFNETTDKNGTLHLENKLMREGGPEVTGLPDLIEDYLKERLPETGTFVMFRPLFSSVDRFKLLILDSKSKSDEVVTSFLKDLYGFYPSTEVIGKPVEMVTEQLPDGFGVPEIRTAASSEWRYIAAPSAKEAKKKTRFYKSYATADSHKKDSELVYRFKVNGSDPDWKTIKEVQSEAVDSVTAKSASTDNSDQEWLKDMEAHEASRLMGHLATAITQGSQKVII